MDSEHLRTTIRANANELARLHARVHETCKDRDTNPQQNTQWKSACAEFHARYDSLSFPGGYSGALDRISGGEAFSIEAGLCFLECRPYFFRSGYMYKDILRRLKRANLSLSQAERLINIVEGLERWKASRSLKTTVSELEDNVEG